MKSYSLALQVAFSFPLRSNTVSGSLACSPALWNTWSPGSSWQDLGWKREHTDSTVSVQKGHLSPPLTVWCRSIHVGDMEEHSEHRVVTNFSTALWEICVQGLAGPFLPMPQPWGLLLISLNICNLFWM